VASYKVQVQTDGGSWSTAVSSTSGSQYDRTLTNARTYRFRVRATDKEGNTGLYTYGSTFKVWRYQDTSSTVQLSGHWTTRRVKATLGKHHSFTSSTAASASLIMTMRDVAVVATKTSKSGHAEVWIDGSLAGTVDLHAKSTKYRKVVFRHHFTDLAGHTIKLLPVGDGRIHLDAFLTLR
jgi:flagellar hook-associated protein FlgK